MDSLSIAKAISISYDALCRVRCRDTFISILTNTNDLTMLYHLLTSLGYENVLINFIRICFYFNKENHLSLLKDIIMPILINDRNNLVSEFININMNLDDSTDFYDDWDIDTKKVQNICSLSFKLACEALFHLLFTLKKSHNTTNECIFQIDNEHDALNINSYPQPELALWLLEIFVNFLRQSKTINPKVMNSMVNHVLFPKALVNLMLEMISMRGLSEKIRLSFLHLVTFLSEADTRHVIPLSPKNLVNIRFTTSQISLLRALLDDIYTSLGGSDNLNNDLNSFLLPHFFKH